jgi:hypothetical protein
MRHLVLLILIGALMVSASHCWAEIPHLINYQGMLTDDAGDPMSGSYDLTLSIYDAAAEGTSLWTEEHSGVSVEDGLFNLTLGSETVGGIPGSVFEGAEAYLGIKVGSGSELTPRIRLLSVGYAYRASVADSASIAVSVPTGGGWTDDGKVVRLEAEDDSVGIGTTSPSAKLDVKGDINVDSFYKIGGKTVLSTAGSENTFVGENLGYSSTTGPDNTFVGARAGQLNTTGQRNTFLGSSAGEENTEGSYNTFVGRGAGDDNTTGNENVFLGYYAGEYNKTGSRNTFLGNLAGEENTEGSYNTFVGSEAGEWSETGYSNTSVGCYAGFTNIEGDSNVFLGYEAGYNETGSHKLYIANSSTTSPLIYGEFDNQRVTINGRLGIGTTDPQQQLDVTDDANIGNGASADGPAEFLRIRAQSDDWYVGAVNQGDPANADFFIGKETDDGTFHIENEGNVGIGTVSPTQKLDVNGTARLRGISDQTGEVTDVVVDANGVLYKKVSVSSKRHKTNIRRIDIEPEEILKLQTVRFEWKESGKEDVGLIAEDVEMAVPDLVIYDDQGRPNGVRYDKLALYLLETMKDLKVENEELKSRIEVLESRE